MSIQIPKRFQEKILPIVLNSIFNNELNSGNGIVTYLEMSPYYFDEYTMHGIRHINAVLEYADKLIPQSTYEKLSERDISILVMGILLHDLGMFIKESGLNSLLHISVKTVRDNDDTCYTWKELWDRYIAKLKHASGKELHEIFGNDEHVFDISSRRVCAAFIRTYHHQIAYHIAINGFPGEKSHNLLNGIGKEYAKLVGILAKSHGVALRDLDEEINAFGYDNNIPLNVPIYYLMSILRLADLLDADENRAPKILSDMNKFSSPRSENEWTLNQLIRGRQWADETGKPDTLKMIASPNNSKQFLELKSWFNYWQKELDLSWAIIGETHNDKYKLSIRRISSNIFNADYDFVTNAIELKVNPDIVKLLVAPLYGDDPSYGVRELLQNAIDACNERTEIDGTIGEIVIDVDTENGIFKITDNGIGMNEDVIANYYLAAGASYRYNRQWAENFLDSESNPKIARSGRFGIGALATFLIGNQAKVVTRHIDDIKGYCFEYTIEPTLLNVDKIEKTCPGTTIEIVMNKKAIGNLTDRWIGWTKWYHFTTPNIIYRVNGKELKKEKIYNLRKDEDSESWFSCDSSDYDCFHWTVEHYIEGNFMCNGIHIPNNRTYYRDSPIQRSLKQRGYYHTEPTISVIDKKGIFPLDLARKTVFDTFSLDDNVVVELCKYQIAKLFVYGENSNCIFNKRGFIPKERSFVLNIARPVYLIGKADSTFEVTTHFKQHDVAIGFFRADKKIYSKNVANAIVGDDLTWGAPVTEIWANNLFINVPKTVGYLPPKNMIHSIDDSKGDWYNDIPIPSSLIGKNTNLIVKYEPFSIGEDENNIMFNTIQELLPNKINGGWIPFDEKERETLYCDTYEKLKRYIDYLRVKKGNKKR